MSPNYNSTQKYSTSVVICTRNRASQLRNTLRSLRSVRIPSGESVELLVVDNGSSDHTQEVIRQASLPQFRVRAIKEAQSGISHARNTAVRQANGDILLFTDDDVRVPDNWIAGMTAPVRAGDADAVAGGVELAPHLQRPWQRTDPWLTTPLATTHVLDPENPQRLVGANMAIARRVFEAVPQFDIDLGAGTKLGMGEETLLTHQIKHHGFDLTSAFDVTVEHHCAPDRLSRQCYLEAAEQIGRSQGYIDYHWTHTSVQPVRLLGELAWRYFKLAARRTLSRKALPAEGIPEWEMVLLTQIYHRRQLLAERNNPRKYQKTDPSGTASHLDAGAMDHFPSES